MRAEAKEEWGRALQLHAARRNHLTSEYLLVITEPSACSGAHGRARRAARGMGGQGRARASTWQHGVRGARARLPAGGGGM